jgi:uncharacterized DUF497 family protein
LLFVPDELVSQCTNQFDPPALRCFAGSNGRALSKSGQVTDLEMTKRFEWDQVKAAHNARKHGVTFDEARTVFADDLAGIAPDPDHASEKEDRELIAGLSSQSRLLLVSFLEHNDVVRIISARLLTRYERRLYEEEKFP